MPQAKKGKFQVVGKFIDEKGNPVRPGNIVELELDEDGGPVNTLIASRVRPFTGSLPAGDGVDAARAEAEKVIEDAKKEAGKAAEKVIEDAKKEAGKAAEKVIEDAEKEAAKIIDEAGKAAEKIIEDAGKSTKK